MRLIDQVYEALKAHSNAFSPALLSAVEKAMISKYCAAGWEPGAVVEMILRRPEDPNQAGLNSRAILRIYPADQPIRILAQGRSAQTIDPSTEHLFWVCYLRQRTDPIGDEQVLDAFREELRIAMENRVQAIPPATTHQTNPKTTTNRGSTWKP